jgi:hypothetical protein
MMCDDGMLKMANYVHHVLILNFIQEIIGKQDGFPLGPKLDKLKIFIFREL